MQTEKEIKKLFDAMRECDRTCRRCRSKNVELPYRILVTEIKGGGRFERFDLFCKDCHNTVEIVNIVCQCGSYSVSEIHNSSSDGRGGYSEWWVYHCSKCGYAIVRDCDGDLDGYRHDGIKG